MSLKDTICAIATPPGQGGIGIVRISGDAASSVLKEIWRGRVGVDSFESHKMYLGNVAEIDSALAVIMRKPHSYTGEDVVELSMHGGPAVLEQILALCQKAGARPAGPGEFTKRAFLNGKMDLAQAEAVADLIAATSEAACRVATRQLEGRLSDEMNGIMEKLTRLCAFVEASIDFPEEDIELIEGEGIRRGLSEIASKLRRLSDSYNEGRLLKDGVNVAIIGKPNVGKSSLFNALAGHDRAIVHHTSGTTRDLVTETVTIGGLAFHLADAAGLREPEHEVEKIGIEKARDALSRADLVLFVVDGSKLRDHEDEKIFRSLNRERTIVCTNKSDLPQHAGGGTMATEGELSVSALKGDGIDLLKRELLGRVANDVRCGEGVIITSARHKEILDHATTNIEGAIKAADEKQSAEFIAHHMRQAHDILGQIVGVTTGDAILDQIFSRFCIGK